MNFIKVTLSEGGELPGLVNGDHIRTITDYEHHRYIHFHNGNGTVTGAVSVADTLDELFAKLKACEYATEQPVGPSPGSEQTPLGGTRIGFHLHEDPRADSSAASRPAYIAPLTEE